MAESAGAGLLESALILVQKIGEVATADPLSAVLVTVGAVLMGVTMLVFGYLTLGAVAKGFIDALPSPGAPPRPDR